MLTSSCLHSASRQIMGESTQRVGVSCLGSLERVVVWKVGCHWPSWVQPGRLYCKICVTSRWKDGELDWIFVANFYLLHNQFKQSSSLGRHLQWQKKIGGTMHSKHIGESDVSTASDSIIYSNRSIQAAWTCWKSSAISHHKLFH